MKILITGTGMDGPTLAEILLEQGHQVYNLKRRSGKTDLSNLKKCFSYNNYHLIEGDILEAAAISQLIKDNQFDHIYNTAAQSHVSYSFNHPSLTFNINVMGYLNILEAVRYLSPHTKVINFGSSEQFGNVRGNKMRRDILTDKSWVGTDIVEALDMTCEFCPESPYACSKVAAHHLTRNYRDLGLWVCQPIMFNHENRYRSPDFVTQKIIQYVTKLYRGDAKEPLELGNIAARRDWSASDDFMRALTLIIELDKPKDYVLASGEDYSVEDFLERAFGIIGERWQDHVIISPKFFRPNEVHRLCGNSCEIRNDLGWTPSISFDQLIKDMFRYACPEFYNTLTITGNPEDFVDFISRYRRLQTA